MNLDIVRLSSKGQLVIPGEVRKRLGLRAGSKLALFTDGGNILLKAVPLPELSAFRSMATEARKMEKQAAARRRAATSSRL